MDDEDAEVREVRDVLVAAAESIIETKPDYGYLIVMVKPDGKEDQGLNYATNFEPEGLHIIAQAFSPGGRLDDADSSDGDSHFSVPHTHTRTVQ